MKHSACKGWIEKMTILIVEDNPGVRKVLRRAVAGLTTTIQECSDGCFALPAYKTWQPDVVLMDIRMETMDGLTATREIIGAYPNARIVIVTDHDDEQLRAAAVHAGACAYFLKEKLTDLAELVRAVAARSAGEEEAGAVNPASSGL